MGGQQGRSPVQRLGEAASQASRHRRGREERDCGIPQIVVENAPGHPELNPGIGDHHVEAMHRKVGDQIGQDLSLKCSDKSVFVMIGLPL